MPRSIIRGIMQRLAPAQAPPAPAPAPPAPAPAPAPPAPAPAPAPAPQAPAPAPARRLNPTETLVQQNIGDILRLLMIGKVYDANNNPPSRPASLPDFVQAIRFYAGELNIPRETLITYDGVKFQNGEIMVTGDTAKHKNILIKILSNNNTNIFSFITDDLIAEVTGLNINKPNCGSFYALMYKYFLQDNQPKRVQHRGQIVEYLRNNPQVNADLKEKIKGVLFVRNESQTTEKYMFIKDYTDILSIMGIKPDDITQKCKDPLYGLFTYLLQIISTISDENFDISGLVESSDTVVDEATKSEIYDLNNINAYKLDPRQNIAVQRFSKFKQKDDKACFLFHGVGTGKTMTSLSILTTHLTEENIVGSTGFKPLKILVIAPNGLFRASFLSDCKNLGIYTYNVTVNNIDGDNVVIETCIGLAKCSTDPSKEYRIEFTGYDYDSFFHTNGGLLGVLDENDYVIFDEAHRLVKSYLPLPQKQTKWELFEIDCKNKRVGKQTADKEEIRNVLRDYRFVEFIEKKKQAIFLTGTPIQYSADDIIDIAWFLNCPMINKSNSEEFYKECLNKGGNRGMFQTIKSWKYILKGSSSSQAIIDGLIGGLQLAVSASDIVPRFAQTVLTALAPSGGGDGEETDNLAVGETDNLAVGDAIRYDILGALEPFFEKPNLDNILTLIENNVISDLLKKIDPNDLYVTSSNIESKIFSILFEDYLLYRVHTLKNPPEAEILEGGTLEGLDLVYEVIKGTFDFLARFIANFNSVKMFKIVLMLAVASLLSLITGPVIATDVVLTPIALKIINFVLSSLLSFYKNLVEIDFDNLYKFTIPYVSVYNYDFDKYAIKQDIYYDIDQLNTIKIPVNCKGNKRKYPERYVTSLLIPFNESQGIQLNKINDMLNVKLHTIKSDLEKYYQKKEEAEELKRKGRFRMQKRSENDDLDFNISDADAEIANLEKLQKEILAIDINNETSNIGCGVTDINENDIMQINVSNLETSSGTDIFSSIFSNYKSWEAKYKEKEVDYITRYKKLNDAPQYNDSLSVNIPNNFCKDIQDTINRIKNFAPPEKIIQIIEFIVSAYLITGDSETASLNSTFTNQQFQIYYDIPQEQKEYIMRGFRGIDIFIVTDVLNDIFTNLGDETIDSKGLIEKFVPLYLHYIDTYGDEDPNGNANGNEDPNGNANGNEDPNGNANGNEDPNGNANGNAINNGPWTPEQISDWLTTKGQALKDSVMALKARVEENAAALTARAAELTARAAQMLGREPVANCNDLETDIADKKCLPEDNNDLSRIMQIINDSVHKYKILNSTPNSRTIDNDKLRFENVLEQLKLIRCGLLYYNFGNVLHAHYRKPLVEGKSYEYFLPIVYPSTEKIMYGFCHFLIKNNYKFIWLCNKFDKARNEKNFTYGKLFTYPISGSDNDNPICIIISPDHTEGYSFVFNPAICIPALCNTAGDQEQVHGRILRKYRDDTKYGRYDKMMYQITGGNDNDLKHLNQLATLYRIDANHHFDTNIDSAAKKQKDTPLDYNTTLYISRRVITGIQIFRQSLMNILPDEIIKAFANHEVFLQSGQNSGIDISQTNKDATVQTRLDSYKNIYPSEEFHLQELIKVTQINKKYFDKLTFNENNSFSCRDDIRTIKPEDLVQAAKRKTSYNYCLYNGINSILNICDNNPPQNNQQIVFKIKDDTDRKKFLTKFYKIYDPDNPKNEQMIIKIMVLKDAAGINFNTQLNELAQNFGVNEEDINKLLNDSPNNITVQANTQRVRDLNKKAYRMMRARGGKYTIKNPQKNRQNKKTIKKNRVKNLKKTIKQKFKKNKNTYKK